MSDQPHVYFYGRLNVGGYQDDKRSFVIKGLSSEQTIEAHSHVWKFIDVAVLERVEGVFIHGYLVKYKRERIEETVDEAAGQIQGMLIPNLVMAKARFFVHVETGIIAYHPVADQISPGLFRERFVKLFLQNHDNFMALAEIDTIQEQYTLRDEIRRMTVVQKLHIALHPSNPNSRDIWRPHDERLQRLGVETYQEDYKMRPESANGEELLADEQVLSKLLMAEDGYGEVRVKGRIDGKVKTIRTHDSPLTSNAPNDDATPANVLESLMLIIDQLLRRFRS